MQNAEQKIRALRSEALLIKGTPAHLVPLLSHYPMAYEAIHDSKVTPHKSALSSLVIYEYCVSCIWISLKWSWPNVDRKFW